MSRVNDALAEHNRQQLVYRIFDLDRAIETIASERNRIQSSETAAIDLLFTIETLIALRDKVKAEKDVMELVK